MNTQDPRRTADEWPKHREKSRRRKARKRTRKAAQANDWASRGSK